MATFYGDPGRFGYNRAELSVTGGATSQPVIVDVIYNAMTVGVIPQGTAKAQFTLCDKSTIQNDTATWFDWDIGETSEASADTIYGVVSAIRLVSINGSAILKVVAR